MPPRPLNRKAKCHPDSKHYAKGLCRSCYSITQYADKPEAWREQSRAAWRATYEERKQRVYAAYGNACACCGEIEQAFLSIDHVNNDGGAHRRKLFGPQWKLKNCGYRIYYEIERFGYPKGRFQLMCMNCNFAKRRLGYCPHSPEPRVITRKAA